MTQNCLILVRKNVGSAILNLDNASVHKIIQIYILSNTFERILKENSPISYFPFIQHALFTCFSWENYYNHLHCFLVTALTLITFLSKETCCPFVLHLLNVQNNILRHWSMLRIHLNITTTQMSFSTKVYFRVFLPVSIVLHYSWRVLC